MKFFAASIDSKIEKIDLHFLSNPDESIIFLEKELYKLYSENEKYCKIIHGIGEGILVKKVHDFLKKQKIIEEYRLDESGGASIIIFK